MDCAHCGTDMETREVVDLYGHESRVSTDLDAGHFRPYTNYQCTFDVYTAY